jgi:hypothetical protein
LPRNRALPELTGPEGHPLVALVGLVNHLVSTDDQVGRARGDRHERQALQGELQRIGQLCRYQLERLERLLGGPGYEPVADAQARTRLDSILLRDLTEEEP